MEIYYNNSKIRKNQFLQPSETQTKPVITFPFDKKKFYTLIMHDPDSIYGTLIHWAIINISENINNGDIILQYKGPTPPPKTGNHHYIFTIYEQLNKINMRNNYINERTIDMFKFKKLLGISNIVPISKFQFISKFIGKGTSKNITYKKGGTKTKRNMKTNKKIKRNIKTKRKR